MTPWSAEMLLVEDSPGEVRLTQEALLEGKVRNKLHVVGDGKEALRFLRGEGNFVGAVRPDLILLDWELPKDGGREALREIKADPGLRSIPVVALTTSQADVDILRGYQLQISCYMTKPVDWRQFLGVVQSVGHLWISVQTPPPG